MATAFHLDTPQPPDDVGLLRPVHELPELGDELVDRCFGHLDPVRRGATAQTLRAWFEARGSADSAAEALFVPKNTLRYRLRIFTEATRLELDRPQDAFTVWWAPRRLDALRRGRRDPGLEEFPDPTARVQPRVTRCNEPEAWIGQPGISDPDAPGEPT